MRGRRGTWRHRPSLAGLALGAWRHQRAFCLAGVALRDIELHFCVASVATSMCVLNGRRGTCGTGLALVARLGPVCRRGRRGCLCGRRGAWRHRPSLCVAGVALGDIDLHFV